MDYSGPVSATSIPPPAPPPPPASFGAPKVLVTGRGSPANRDNIRGISATKPTERPIPFAGVHPETLQHAAKRLRPTQHREPLFPSEREQFLDGQDQLADRRYWPNQQEHAPLAEYQTGAKVHAPSDDFQQSAPLRFNAGHSTSLSPGVSFVPVQQQQQTQPSSSSPSAFNSTTTTTTTISREIPIQLVGPLPGQTFSPGPPPPPPPPSNASSYLITEPKRYIHAYATQTPASTILDENRPIRDANRMVNNNQAHSTNNFSKELRDQGLTERQRAANQQQTPQYRTTTAPPSSLQNYTYQTVTSTSSNSSAAQQPPSSSATATDQQVDQLIREMEWKMRTGYGAAGEDYCTKCRQQITGDPPGVTALGQAYHVTCFCCDQCQKQLAGCSFYSVDGKNLCQVDYMNSLEKCDKCKMPITQKILRALGKAFHPECFSCPSCQKSLDGIPFTVDKENCAYCLDCYHERFSPRCAACLKVIAPSGNETEVARVIAMDRSYHLDCYKCEDCGLKLNSKIEGQGCYPLESHLFCKNCNLKRLKSLK